MFCPFCGQPTELRDNHLYCPATNTEFSDWIKSQLTELVAAPATPHREVPYAVGKTWFCPADGTKTMKVEGTVACPRCARSLSGQVLYNLTEMQAHP